MVTRKAWDCWDDLRFLKYDQGLIQSTANSLINDSAKKETSSQLQEIMKLKKHMTTSRYIKSKIRVFICIIMDIHPVLIDTLNVANVI